MTNECPCCLRTDECPNDCTFATDNPVGFAHLEEIRSLTRQLDAAVGEIRARREDAAYYKHVQSLEVQAARAAVDATPELRARLEAK